jgi:hypothetical protein
MMGEYHGGLSDRRKGLATEGQVESKNRPQWFLACALNVEILGAGLLVERVALALSLFGAST